MKIAKKSYINILFMPQRIRIQNFVALMLVFLIAAAPFAVVFASPKTDIDEDIVRKNQQIEELERQIASLSQELLQKRTTALSVQEEVARLDAEIRKNDLEIKSLSLAVERLNLQIKKNQEQIQETDGKIDRTRVSLAIALRVLDKTEKITPVELLVSKPSLSSFFNDLYDFYFLQSSVKRKALELKDAKQILEQIQTGLEEALQERQQLKALEELAKTQAARKKNDQKTYLNKIKKDESSIQGKIKKTEIDLSRLREQITYLMRAGISVEDALRYGQLAAIALGIRPAFLIAVLEIESRLGQNVGTGNWKKDMHPRDHEAFLAITSKLNLDPDKTPVSKKPSYGWGGAMGPAQFLPNTWLAYEAEVARITGHNPPSPWNIEDAFTAAAIKLSRQGATSKTRAGEIAATKAYISGSSSCSKSICNYYANAVLNKAEEIEQELGS